MANRDCTLPGCEHHADGDAPDFRISHPLCWASRQDPGVRLAETRVRGEKASYGMVSASPGLPKNKSLYRRSLRLTKQQSRGGLATHRTPVPEWHVYMQLACCRGVTDGLRHACVWSGESAVGGSSEGGSASLRSPGALRGSTASAPLCPHAPLPLHTVRF